MFQVDTRIQQIAAEEMQEQTRILKQCISATEEVEIWLSHMSIYEDVAKTLAHVRKEEEDEHTSYFSMISGLLTIAECYMTTEKNICDYAEEEGRKTVRIDWEPEWVSIKTGQIEDVNIIT